MKLNIKKFMMTEMGGGTGRNDQGVGSGTGRKKKSDAGNWRSGSGTGLRILGSYLQKLSGQMGSFQVSNQTVLWN